MTLFWDREGKPITEGRGDGVIEWAMKFEDSEYRIVAVDQDEPGGPMVSTIWQGIDLNHSIIPTENPAIFETVILYAKQDNPQQSEIDHREFSVSEEEAFEVHAMFCRTYLGREPVLPTGLKDEIIAREKERKGL